MNDHEREMWVLNDEALHLWWRVSKLPMREFLRAKRKGLDTYIQQAMDKPLRR